ncbi:MAG: DUF3179 domain-containing (seleno)protein [Chloroflexota bacterium]
MTILYLLAAIALLTSVAFIVISLIKSLPLQWLYYHYFIRKPVVLLIFGGSLFWEIGLASNNGSVRLEAAVPLALMVLAVALAYRLHPEVAFQAVDFPVMSERPFQLPLTGDTQLAIIEYEGVTKAYPLEYVAHHHIINDRFGEHLVALTYCPMCRSIIPFDVTEIGALFVVALKNANMITADRHTRTFFQQATFESVIGPLHPYALTMIHFQTLPWREVRRLDVLPQICQVTLNDFREFQLPVPWVWRKIMASEITPGLPSKDKDKSFPARTHVIGVIDPIAKPQVVYLKSELIQHGVVKNKALDAVFVALNDTVSAFKGNVAGTLLDLIINSDGTLYDKHSGTVWDVRGKYKSGIIKSDLEVVATSDEYWYSWKFFHPQSQLIRLH